MKIQKINKYYQKNKLKISQIKYHNYKKIIYNYNRNFKEARFKKTKQFKNIKKKINILAKLKMIQHFIKMKINN